MENQENHEQMFWRQSRVSSLWAIIYIEIVSPSAMVPAHRMVTLFQQAKDYQIHKCLFHLRFSDGPHSLLTDHSCDSDAFPSATIKVLSGHQDEVWDIKFSHDGTKLASSSKDNSVIIWDTEVVFLFSWLTLDLGTITCLSRSHWRSRVARLVSRRRTITHRRP
jgi:hypothetical protein